MTIVQLLYSVGGTDIAEYPDFDTALADLTTGDNRDFLNMTLMEIDLDSNVIGRTMDGATINAVANGQPPPIEQKNEEVVDEI